MSEERIYKEIIFKSSKSKEGGRTSFSISISPSLLRTRSLSISLGLTAMSFLIAQYDIDDLHELENFLDDYDINDLHSSNMGFFNGKLKFFDFSGYNSDTFELLKNKTA